MSAEPVLDIDNALARLEGDRSLYAELIGFMREDVPQLMQNLCTAVAASDASEIRMKAHAIKGLVAGCGGTRAALAAQKLEDAGSTGDLDQASTKFTELESELETLTVALSEFER